MLFIVQCLNKYQSNEVEENRLIIILSFIAR